MLLYNQKLLKSFYTEPEQKIYKITLKKSLVMKISIQYGTTILLHYITKQKIKEKVENFVCGDFSL